MAKFFFSAACVLCIWSSSDASTIYDNTNAAAEAMVQGMTLSQKIGQMLLPAVDALTMNYAPGGVSGAQEAWIAGGNPPPINKTVGDALGFSAITTYNVGAVLQAAGPLLYSGPLPEGQHLNQWQTLTGILQLYQTEGLPLLLGNDAIHGNQHVVGAILFPHNIGLGATHNPSLVNTIAAWTGYDVRVSGFNWAYMPTVAIAHDYRWGRFYESFSSNDDVVRAMAQNYVAGMQGITNGTTGQIAGAIACVKHFIGDGNTHTGFDEGFTATPDLNTIWQTDGAGYEGAVALTGPIAQVGSAMASYSSLNGIPMHFGGDFDSLNQFRNEGIEYQGSTYQLSGFVVSDYDGVAKAAWKYNVLHGTNINLAEAMAMAINGGIDLIMVSNAAYTNPFDANAFIPPTFTNLSPPYYTNLEDIVSAITTAVDTGLIPISRIDDAVTRIIRTKLATNFAALPSPPAGLSEAAVSLQAAEQSLVLLKNDNGVIPITPGNMEYVFLMGDDDDIGKQNGGWTVIWQGREGNYYWTAADRASAHATSILDGVNQTALGVGAQIVRGEYAILNYPLGGTGGPTASNSVAILAISEIPYAEFMGDVQNQNPWYMLGQAQGLNAYTPSIQNCDLALHLTDQQAQAIDYLHSAGIPVITVVFSGRPIVITESPNAPLPISDALIAAFLPGTSGGQAIANLIFGAYTTKSVSNTINGNLYYSNTLPFAWPASMKEVIRGTPTLFPEGFGL